ncbi:hypothetical protein T492DRAFT_844220 [Pavlovales sp. CCMP2436]|nr:hypothetical protein T492DRAFT_844220 [Pavlovales sp. CCMP2436]
MEKIQILLQFNTITEEETEVKIAPVQTPVQAPVQEPLDVPPPVKVKRTLSEKQKLNYLKANARRLEILADLKAIRVAAALELKRQSDAITVYELAVKLASKYGFNTNASAANRQEESKTEEPTQAPPPPPLRYQMQPPSRPPMQYI